LSLTVSGNVLVELLDAAVVAQEVKALAVRLPQELHPGGQDGAVRAVLRVLPTHSAQQQAGKRQGKG
jgi:hypothetical protein